MTPGRAAFLAAHHFITGRWIRNYLIYPNDNKLDFQADYECGLRAGRWSGTVSDDALCAAILDLFWDTLHK